MEVHKKYNVGMHLIELLKKGLSPKELEQEIAKIKTSEKQNEERP